MEPIMSPRYLVPVDGTTRAEAALPAAVTLAERRDDARLELAIVHVTTPFDGLPDAPWNSMGESMQERYVVDTAARLAQHAGKPVTPTVLYGDAAAAIARHARDGHVDVIVMSTHGRTGLSRAIAGSVADTVIRASGVPVLLLRQTSEEPAPPPAFANILVLDDGSSRAAHIYEGVIAVATPRTQIVILHVVEPVPVIPDPSLPLGYVPGPDDPSATSDVVDAATVALRTRASELATRSGCVVISRVIVAPRIPEAVAKFAETCGADLIAMTTHGRGASRLMFGSVSDALLRATTRPMLVLCPIRS
jgi:nucleotide-binding universal stress UspA family protein